ncbi:acetate--CoA ligase family protein [Nocardioides sp. Bht2]|uniref:acetate--CoA ligase family protein n=1 Tax=Nocardioides sp. Bht2 TaxID=3392297 RepID=UPI0039B6DEC7
MSLPEAFIDPTSVAVVGASADQTKWGHWLALGALKGKARRDVWLVNRSGDDLLGEPTYRSVSDLPGTPDLLVLCVPAGHVLSVVTEALARGTRAFLAITAGVGDQDELALLLQQHDARMLGPNSLGMYDASTDLQLAWGHFTPGRLAIVSQSGQLGSEIANLGARQGLGVSRFYSVGNQLDLNAADLLEGLVDDQQTSAVALYLESFADGARLVRALRALRAAGKPTLILTTGASEGSKRLAQSHTGSMTSTLDVVDAACRAAGALRVSTPSELVATARYLDAADLPQGRRIAVVSDSGGQGGIAADVAAGLGLSTPVFSPELQTQLARMLPAGAALANPVDLAGAGEADLEVYASITELLAGSGEVDAVLMTGYLGCYGEDTPSIADDELAVVDRLGKLSEASHVPLVVHSMSDSSPAVERMWEHHIPAYEGVELALGALARAAQLAEAPGRSLTTPDAAPMPRVPGYWQAHQRLLTMGVPLPAAHRITDRAELAEAVRALQAPLVLKAGWLEHKSEHGGIRIGLRSLADAEAAYDDMVRRLGPGDYVIEEQDTRDGVIEMLIGGRVDRDFGPTVTVGLGGVQAELWRDVHVELAPVDRETARAMVGRLRSKALLDGWRGAPAADADALIDLVVSVSEIVAGSPEITDLEINPVRVAPGGALAVDALVLPLADGTAS